MRMTRGLVLARAGLTTIGLGLLFFSLRGELAHLPRANAVTMSGSVLLALAAFCFYAGRFRTVMRLITLELTPLHALRLTASASFYQAFVPLSVGGDLTRFALCSAAAPGMSRRRIAGGIVLDHLLGSLALAVLAAPWLLRRVAGEGPLFGALVLGAGLLPLLVLTTSRGLRRRTAGILRPLRAHLAGTLAALAFSLGMQTLLAVAVWNLARMWQVEIAFIDLLGVVACGGLLQVVPVNIGGLHLGDLAGGALYMLHGLSLSQAALLATSLYCLRVMVAILGGVWDLAQARLPQSEVVSP